MMKLFDMIITQEQKKKTAKQQKVVEAAITLFAEKGYANTSTAEIAKMAEVSEAIIFKHYGTKNNLLLAIMLPFIKDFLPALVQEVVNETLLEDTNNFEQFFRRFLKNRVVFLNENQEIFQVVIKETIYRDELKKDILPYFSEAVISALVNVIEEFKSRGELLDKPTDQIVQILLTLIGGFLASRFLLFDNYVVGDEEIENIVQFTMNGLRNEDKILKH